MIPLLRPLSRREVRELDVRAVEDLGLPTLILMENAGRGAAYWLAELATAVSPAENCLVARPGTDDWTSQPKHDRGATRILILCGSGNNGGDGAVVARHLDAWEFPVHVRWFAQRESLRGDAAIQATILQRSGVSQSFITATGDDYGATELDSLNNEIMECDWLVDGLLGTGLSRPVGEPLQSVINMMNRSGKPIFALDLPSGLDADSGKPLGVAVRATVTATFVAPKPGFAYATDYTGNVAVIDIGLPRCLLEPYFV